MSSRRQEKRTRLLEDQRTGLNRRIGELTLQLRSAHVKSHRARYASLIVKRRALWEALDRITPKVVQPDAA